MKQFPTLMKRLFGVTFFLVGVTSPALSGEVSPTNVTAGSTNASVNALSNSSSLNQVGGNNITTLYDNSKDTGNGFGVGRVCRGANVSASLFTTRADGFDNRSSIMGGALSFTAPFPSEIDSLCRRQARLVNDQLEITTALGLAKACSELKTLNVQVDLNLPAFEKLRACQVNPNKTNP